jgi:outer membrane protein TolC
VAVILGILCVVGCADPQDPLGRRESNAQADLEALAAARAPAPEDPVSLSEAVGLALEHNLDAAAQQKEREVRAQMIVAERRRMLMDLKANVERTRVDDVQATSSQSLLTGQQSLEPSISSEQYTTRSDVTMAWNLLDFGLTYIESQQAEDRLRSLEWHIARVRQNLVLDVTKAWCRAAVAQEAVKTGRELAVEAEDRMQRLRRLIRRRSLPEVEGLERQKRLMEIQMRLQEFERELAEAKTELGRLMGLAPGIPFQVTSLDEELDTVLPQKDVSHFEREALYNRPELYQSDLQEHIALNDVRKAVLGMLPGLNLFGRYETSSNRFLYHDEWTEVGADAAWDLFNLPKKIAERQLAEKRIELERQQRMAKAVGILAQVHLALLNHQDATERQQVTDRFASIQTRMHQAQKRQLEQGQTTEAAVFEARVNATLAKIRQLESSAEVVVASARICNTLGREPLAEGGWIPHNNRAHDFGTQWTPAEGWRPGAVELMHTGSAQDEQQEDPDLPAARAAPVMAPESEEPVQTPGSEATMEEEAPEGGNKSDDSDEVEPKDVVQEEAGDSTPEAVSASEETPLAALDEDDL